jgi:ABC-type hemin transport system substrate-binding protein
VRSSWLAAAALALAAVCARAQVRTIDDAGVEVVLPQPAQRIVSLAPHLTEQLFAIGAGSRIVATTEFADHPEAARALPRVARAQRRPGAGGGGEAGPDRGLGQRLSAGHPGRAAKAGRAGLR